MAAPVVLVLVAGDAVVEGDFAGQAALRQQFQRAVDGGVSDAGIIFLHQAVQFVGGEMVAGFEERAQNRVALGGLLVAGREMQEKGTFTFVEQAVSMAELGGFMAAKRNRAGTA